MKEMVHLALRTGFTFKQVYGHIDDTLKIGSTTGFIGIADLGNTFSHTVMEQGCKNVRVGDSISKNAPTVEPIYAVRLTVVKDATQKVKPRGQFGCEYIFIAKSYSGLQEIYRLTKVFYDNFYYRGNISVHDVKRLSDQVIVIAENFDYEDRIDYVALTNTTPKMLRDHPLPKVAIVNNFYTKVSDKDVYELFTMPRNNCSQTYQQHILSTEEWRRIYKGHAEIDQAIENTHLIAEQCKGIVLERAPMIKYNGDEKLEFLCKIGAKKKGVDLQDPVYKERLERELSLINERGFQDYFLVVWKMIKKAKKKMLVGSGRGSSGGSLVCYLLSITEGIDPIKHDLLFERFIDINRKDLPDIDIDFPDNKRDSIIKDLISEYGEDSVKHISIVSRMKAKVAIGEFAKSLSIPPYETDAVKNSIIERSGGDARAAMCILDTFETIDIGKEFVKKYPSMKTVAEIENHPRHSGVHAAGIIVCNEPIFNFAGVSGRDDTVMVDKYDAEYLNLLKIDVLGLRTLTVLNECSDLVGMKHQDYYSLDTEDELTFEIFNKMRLNGIFQFEGYSLMSLTRKMGIHKFDDIVAITALARPGALYSGGANRYIKYRLGEEIPEYVDDLHKSITESTFGIVVFQEQILRICREIGKMSWTDVNKLRKALSKSLGEEFFSRYKEKFMKGAKENGYTEEQGEFVWGEVCYGGNYAFNKSHAVAYALISYWCAYMKIRYPKEFTVANLNNAKDNDSAIKILRDAVTEDGIEYIAIDPDESMKKWSVNSQGVVVGGLLNIDGVGPANANKIIASRKEGGDALAAGLVKKLLNPVTHFDILFPCDHYWGDIFRRPSVYGLTVAPSKISEVQTKGTYLFIGRLINKNIRDLNEYVNVQKRNGKLLEDHTLELALKLEDDTDSIMASINRWEYEEKGRHIAETGTVDEDWYLIKGEIKFESRYVAIKEIMKLDHSMIEGN